jgi:hypothetical protein
LTESARVVPPGTTRDSFLKPCFPANVRKAAASSAWRNDDHFLNTLALLERFERMKDDRKSCKVQKLLRPIACHPAARSGGGNDRGVH